MTDPEVHVLGQLVDASNGVFLARLGTSPDEGVLAVYKPVRGERPLWDFPDGNLAGREVAAYLISDAGGWDVVPPTRWLPGPFGVGSVQVWVTEDPIATAESLELDDESPSDSEMSTPVRPDDVVIAPAEHVPPDCHAIVDARLHDGTEVVIAHADSPELRTMALFDAVINNSDRKGAHVLRDDAGHLWGVDHGVSLHSEDKLRTILWGFAGTPIGPADRARLEATRDALEGDLSGALSAYLTEAEIQALRWRVQRLLTEETFPEPQDDWPSVPWPPI